MKTLKWKIVLIIFISMLLLLLPKVVFAAPMNNQIIEVQNSYTDEKGQKKDCTVKVSVTGDEFYSKVKSIDGYTLIEDPDTKSMCYAVLNNQGEFISSKTPYTGLDTNNEKTFKKVMKQDLTEDKNVIQKKINKNKQLLNYNNTSNAPAMPNAFNAAPAALPAPASASSVPAASSPIAPTVASASMAPTPAATSRYSGNIVGLTILIDFPDVKSTYTKAQIETGCNGQGYYQNGNPISVNQAFSDMSGGKLNYTNIVVTYTTKYNKSYYADPDWFISDYKIRTEALQYLGQTGFDFSKLTKDEEGYVRALNFICGDFGGHYCAGYAGADSITVNGTNFLRYTAMPIDVLNGSVAVFCHENGHMLLDLPDMYDDNGGSVGLGAFDLMSANVFRLNPYFRYVLGWGTTTVISGNGTKTINVNPLESQMIPLTSNEMFFIENLPEKSFYGNQSTELPPVKHYDWHAGLYIYHVDTNKINNAEEAMTTANHYLVSLEQADGKFHLEKGPYPLDLTDEGGDAYRAGYATSFTPTTTPNSNLWTGQSSGVSITNVSAAGSTMQYTYNNTNSTITYPAGPTVAIGAPSTTTAKSGETVTYKVTYKGKYFNTSTLSPANITLNKTGTANRDSISRRNKNGWLGRVWRIPNN
ncbi:MAG: hypothetical protein FWC53_00595 [Firmicutes bacterium]|nr:hypothetical protein [Bacillota bacterium]